MFGIALLYKCLVLTNSGNAFPPFPSANDVSNNHNDHVINIMMYGCNNRYKYAYMEEMLGNVGGARQIFERWMTWMPDANAWNSYIRLEIR
jgi:hypothetical protein